MKNALIGAALASLVFSVALNFAQYNGVLSSPQVVKLEPSDQEKLAAIYGGL